MSKFWIFWIIGMTLNFIAYPLIFTDHLVWSFILNGLAVLCFIVGLVFYSMEDD